MTDPKGLSSFSLKGKVALVTGSSRGMGRQHALFLASLGADVVVNYATSVGPANEVVESIKGTGQRGIAVRADMSKPEEIAALFQSAVSTFGKLDIVISNSGLEHFGALDEVTPADFDRIFAVNTRGQFFVAQQAHKHLVEGGCLIMLSSISASARSVHNHAVYSGSKGAIEAFTRCFATDFGDKKIRVNCIAPGGVKTDMYIDAARKYIPDAESWSDEKVDQAISNLSPLGRPGYPEDISRVIGFLVSEAGGWINGQVLTISGGAIM